MTRVIGAKAHADRLRRMTSSAAQTRIGQALYKAGKVIGDEAKLSITKGSISGKGHVPSKPGEPPNADSRTLDGNIETAQEAPLKVTVTSNAPYAAALELGTSRMAARPYMKPAVAKKRAEVTAYIRAVVDNIVKGA